MTTRIQLPVALLAEIDAGALIPTLVVAGAVFAFVFWIVRAIASGDLEQGNEWRYDVSRINDLRKADTIYRWFQPVIQALARFNRGAFKDALPKIQREIVAAGLPRCWLPEEYLGKLEFYVLAITPLVMGVAVWRLGAVGIPFAILFLIFLLFMLRRQLRMQAESRLKEIKRRLPFMLDLMTLLMEAGTTFIHALEQSVIEYKGHPLSQEFSRVLTDMNLGKTRKQAFEAMRDRLQDDEVTSILTSILQSEQLGTPLAGVFRTHSDVLRLKRSQRAEAVAAEAGVKMLLPGVLVMASTVIVIIGPFALNFIMFGFQME